MNLQFHHVISDITGLTGIAIIEAILKGERDPAVLSEMRDKGSKLPPKSLLQLSLAGCGKTGFLNDFLPEALVFRDEVST